MRPWRMRSLNLVSSSVNKRDACQRLLLYTIQEFYFKKVFHGEFTLQSKKIIHHINNIQMLYTHMKYDFSSQNMYSINIWGISK